ncbi:uncharacterized protein F4817DRAFT_73859 [Daldinia loculata]|uniref:uncharacterized protein n=1 Tax=Daldinia loculata TaxID=103429 RepID=UPI0020C2ACF9|nr:uncharacterized protein F4817DRAFT_73859 [Daldinia loculata]KAI1648133.1 hypothetical protein F4817DRAFT_73859 [Daldinia loculata]
MDAHWGRKQSDSTVQTVDETALEYYREDSVLKPVSARAHTDDWPCFLLTNATIFHKDGTLANLLHVDLEGPLIVRGKLEIEKDQERFLINRHMKNRSPYIQLQDTLSFSIGLKEDRPPMPVLWASGGAGWYEIVPSDAYKDICNTMFQGISLHYAILDQYEVALEKLQKTKKNRNKTLSDVKLVLNDVLIKYAVNVGDGITSAEASQRIKDQAIFLLCHFPKDTEFHRTLAEEYPDIVQQLAAKESSDAKAATSSEPSTLVAVPYRDQEKSSSLEVTNNKKSGRPSLRNSTSRLQRDSEDIERQVAETIEASKRLSVQPTVIKQELPVNTLPEPADSSDPDLIVVGFRTKYNRPREYHNVDKQLDPRSFGEPSAAVSAIIGVLQDYRQDLLSLPGDKTKHPDEVTASNWHTKLYRGLSVKKPRALAQVCIYHARDLLRFLGPEWHSSKFYTWLEENVDVEPSFEDLSEERMKNIVRRKKKNQLPHNDQSSYEDQPYEHLPYEDLPYANQSSVPNQPPHATPSSYSSRISRASRSSYLNQPSHELPAAMEYQEEKVQGQQPPNRARTSGKVAGLRPSIGGKKRLRQDFGLGDEMELDEDGPQKNASKKSRYSSTEDDHDEHDEEREATTSSGNEYNAEDEDALTTGTVGHSTKPPKPNRNGVDDAWFCEESGCDFVVHADNEDDAEALIMPHYELHHKDARTKKYASQKLNLQNIVREESLITGGLPVGFLLKKISRYTAALESRDEEECKKRLEAERQSRRSKPQGQKSQLEDQATQLQSQEMQFDVEAVPEPKERDTLQ